MRRFLDIVLTAAGLIVLLPLFVLVAIAIRLDSKGPVFFRQRRMGLHLRAFEMLKFRTMVENAAAIGPRITVGRDPRITRVGRLLRGTKIDELPQLINVLRGEMSLVGSRPEVEHYVMLYPQDYRTILKNRPGITDVASIVYREENELLAKSEDPEGTYVHVILPDKIRLAKQYARDASLLHDFKVIVTTLVYLLYPSRPLDHVLEVMSRRRVVITAAIQALLFAGANALAYTLRFDGAIPHKEFTLFLETVGIVVLIRMAWAHWFGLFRGVWRYTGARDLESIVAATTLSSLTIFALVWAVPAFHAYSRAVIVLDWVLATCLLGGARMARRFHESMRNDAMLRKKVLVVGCGDSTEPVLRDIANNRFKDYRVIGLVNGDSGLKGMRIHNVPVLGTRENLEAILRESDPDEVIIACASGPGDRREEIVDSCRKSGKPFRIVPDLRDVLIGKEIPELTRTFEADDLLFREPIRSNGTELAGRFEGRTVMITGAGGSIGSEICRQIAACRPARAILFEKHENSLYEIERTLRLAGYGAEIEAVIGDVTDPVRVEEAMSKFKPEFVFHAAAYKHVPMMEKNAREAFKTNVIGTRTVAEAAIRHGAGHFVLISTDKAVEPVSVMGMTKRIAELTLQGLQNGGGTRLCTVRFGNVLESSGSVIPLFREQIERGGPVTVTHPEATRLFMTIPEAVQLILHAATLGHGGEVFVLDMGKPIRILDMAHALVRLYGFRPGKDVQIVFTGLRPGEKLYEKLFNDDEQIWKTAHPKILMATTRALEDEKREEVRSLARAVEAQAGNGAIAEIALLLPEVPA
jgi:FlaA1/EpsC-like NDP-sugar epimerase/lipopolysaccharide/colanic/teichoic acid biosynthesis glycosyltransferase